MRFIADGLVDREGVGGLARRLCVGERHLHRILVSELGAGPLALARAQRANTARLLIETTDLPFTDVAFAAGFSSVRQFNETMQTVFAAAPTALRAGRRRRDEGPHRPGSVTVHLPVRLPFDGPGLLRFLGMRAVPGVEELVDGSTYRRSIGLPHGDGVVELTAEDTSVRCRLWLADLRDLTAAVERCRRLLDLDADPVAVTHDLGADPLLAPLVAAVPGRRVPGCVDGAELAIRAVLGQQVSVVGARTVAERLTAALGDPLEIDDDSLTHRFPTPAAIAAADPSHFLMPTARRRALQGLASALADGRLVLEPGVDRHLVHVQLLAMPGIGPWTAGYIAMRALGDPDVFLATDLGARRGAAHLVGPDDAVDLAARAEEWRPWRSYALQHLWHAPLPVAR